jgi:hypothetical protein
MIDFESTTAEPSPKSELCVVYDARDGRIVHMHEFIGDGTAMFAPDAQEDRERIALAAVSDLHGDLENLGVLPTPTDFRLEADAIYRVDQGVLAVSTRLSIREYVGKARKER